MSQPNASSRTRAALIALTTILISTLMSCASIPDDTNPELMRRDGDRAKVFIDEQPFRTQSGGYSVTYTGPDGEARTASVEVSGAVPTWSATAANSLEVYFTDAMVESGAFAVIDRSVVLDKIRDGANDELLEPDRDHRKVLRPDLKLKCTLTDLNPNAEVEHSNFAARSWNWLASRFSYGWYAWFGGGVQNMSRKATCEIKVAIVDYRSGDTIATATGKGSSVGSSSRVRGSGWGIGGGLSIGSGSQKDANLSLAIERATIRAVNDLITKIPASYFSYSLRSGPAGDSLADGKREAPQQ